MKAPLHQILVHMDDSPAAIRRLALARRLGSAHDAAVTATYAVIPALIEVPFAAEAGPQAVSALREIDEDRCARARAGFDEAVKGPGVHATWSQLSGYPLVPAFSQQAFYADLVVLGQHEPAGSPDGIPYDFVESVIVTSGKPVLVVPYTSGEPQVPSTVAVAWKPTREAARAIAAALPFLQQARKVHVMAWGVQEEMPPGGLDLASWLKLRGVDATFHREADAEPDTVGDFFLSRAFELGADLLVMGCYGHSRAREWVLGGASRTVLQSMTVPVLMAH